MGLALDEPDKGEVPTRVNGLDVLVSDEVKDFAGASRVDYVNSPYGEIFTVDTGRAGCSSG